MRRRTVAATCAAALAVASPAEALVLASATSPPAAVGSGSFAAGWAVGGQAAPGPLQLTVARSPKAVPAPTYVDLVNVGTLPLVGASYAVTVTGQREAMLEACTGDWDEATHACSGTVVTLATSGSGLTDSSVTVPSPGDRRRLRVRVPRTLPQDVVVTVDVAVARSHARPAVTVSA